MSQQYPTGSPHLGFVEPTCHVEGNQGETIRNASSGNNQDSGHGESTLEREVRKTSSAVLGNDDAQQSIVIGENDEDIISAICILKASNSHVRIICVIANTIFRC
jgi:hypothetical protein